MSLTESDLRRFTGSEQVFRHSLVRRMIYTEGVKFLAERGKAFWLIDKIATLQLEPKIRASDFQVWKLVVTNGAATLSCSDDETLLHSEHISFTDFPLDSVDVWVEGDVILLPSEH